MLFLPATINIGLLDHNIVNGQIYFVIRRRLIIFSWKLEIITRFMMINCMDSSPPKHKISISLYPLFILIEIILLETNQPQLR